MEHYINVIIDKIHRNTLNVHHIPNQQGTKTCNLRKHRQGDYNGIKSSTKKNHARTLNHTINRTKH